MADILISEQYSPCQATLQPCSPAYCPCSPALLHLPIHQGPDYCSFMRLWLFKTGVCKGEKTVKYTIFTANSRHALTACFWHQIIHNVNAIRWNCYMNMSEAYLLCFHNLRAIVAESEKKHKKYLQFCCFYSILQHILILIFDILRSILFKIVSLDQFH